MEDKKTKILIVDDEPEIVNSLKHFLSGKGYEATGAFSGEEALNILEKEKTDLIILDIMMSGIKGTEIAKSIKEKYPLVKVIVITGYPEEGKKLAKETLLEGLFIKPVGTQELYNKLLSVLGQDKSILLDSTTAQNIKARILLIKAKIIFLEPDNEICNLIKSHLNSLLSQGENYDLETAHTKQEATEKLINFKPDIFAINTAYPKNTDDNLAKEIITYELTPSLPANDKQTELEKLTKSIQMSCLKNGLIEIKWLEI